MTNAGLVGATGLVGANILTTLLAHPSFSAISTFSRRPLQTAETSARLHAVIEPETDKWASTLASLSPHPAIFFSGLGTTRKQAGSIEAQIAIDRDLNMTLARAARKAGARVYVLVSSAGASSGSYIPYSRMKGELDDAVQTMGFEHVVLVKPGLIMGTREDSRPPEYAARVVIDFLGRISGGWLKNPLGQDAHVIARAAVAAGLRCLDGTAPAGKLWTLSGSDIIRLGATEWKA